MQTYKSSSSSETRNLGRTLGEAVLKRGPLKAATVIALAGELGAGKTTFTKGIYEGLGSKSPVTSPTFIIIRHNVLRAAKVSNDEKGNGDNKRIKKSEFRHMFHVDPYRLKDAAALKVLAFNDILKDPQNIVIVEWPERAKGLLPKKLIAVTLHHGRTEHERRIMIKGL